MYVSAYVCESYMFYVVVVVVFFIFFCVSAAAVVVVISCSPVFRLRLFCRLRVLRCLLRTPPFPPVTHSLTHSLFSSPLVVSSYFYCLLLLLLPVVGFLSIVIVAAVGGREMRGSWVPRGGERVAKE